MNERKDRDRGLPRDQDQNSIPPSGRQAGGGPGEADLAAGGGSSGSGGYGRAQDVQNHQGQEGRAAEDRKRAATTEKERGERFDEAQGGGRGPGSVSGA